MNEPAIEPRGPEGLNEGSLAAQALPPPIPEAKGTADKRLYSWKEGKAQFLFCRLAAPKPDSSWTIARIRTENKNPGQLGYTDIKFEAETVSIPKAEDAGYFSGRAVLRTIAIHVPKELDVTAAQIKAAETAKDELRVKTLKAFQACRDLILAHELKHIDDAWGSLSDQSLGWNGKLGGPGEATYKLMCDAVDESGEKGPAKIDERAKKVDEDTLGPLRTEMRGHHVFIDDGDDKEFRYIEGNS